MSRDGRAPKHCLGGHDDETSVNAGVIVLMLWFYWSGMVLLVGGEINAEIDKAATTQAHNDREQEKAA